jgi:hypothetical protein
LKKGLLYLLSAGWEFYPTTALPVDVQWPIVYTISFGATEPGTALRFDAIVVDPSGREVERQEAIAERGNGPVCLRHCFSSLRFTATVAGIWMVNVVSGDLDLASVPIEIKLLPR